MELAKLQLLMNEAAKSSASIEGLNDQLETAKALRNTPAPTGAGDTGYVNPLAHVFREINIRKGRGQVKQAHAGLAKARQQMAETTAAKDVYKLKQAREKLDFDRNVNADKLKYDQAKLKGNKFVWDAETHEPVQISISDDGRTYIDMATGRELARKITDKDPYMEGGALYATTPEGQSTKSHKDVENKNYGFAGRGIKGLNNMRRLLNAGLDPTSVWEVVRGVTNLTMTEEQQQFQQSADDVIKAILRRESGAAIPESEMASYRKTYLPQFGDSDLVAAQKIKSLQNQVNAMMAGAGEGRVYEEDFSPTRGDLPEGVSAEEWNALSDADKEYFRSNLL